jgi:predicted ABC-type transport system involved in lysophospholipase L1 biosynthesis ATPase subunit
MTDGQPAIVEVTALSKQYGGLRPLRVRRLVVASGDRIAIGGVDAAAAEALIHLMTGAAVADEGTVAVAGRDTRAIATDTEWLASLDRFGIVTERAVLIDALSIAGNLALPISLSIDPMPDEVRRQVEALATEVGLASDRLDEAAATLTAEERVRVHVARALAPRPEILLLEHPTARVDPPAAGRLGDALRAIAETRRIGFVALTEDAAFARATGATRLRLVPATGELRPEPTRWWPRWR